MITYQDFGRGSAGGSVNGAAAWRSYGISVSSPGIVRVRNDGGALPGVGAVWVGAREDRIVDRIGMLALVVCHFALGLDSVD
eukprot:4757490-Pleurochrysis_carterae.AAC.1